MELMFTTNSKNFLDIYESEIVFLDNFYFAEEPHAVNAFLEEYGFSIEDLKQLGLKAMKNKITIPKGTHANILNIKNGEALIEIKGYRFNIISTFEADAVMIEATAKDKEFEALFSKLKNKIPKYEDNITLYGHNIADIISAIDFSFGFNSKRFAQEKLKSMTKEEIDALMIRSKNRSIAIQNSLDNKS